MTATDLLDRLGDSVNGLLNRAQGQTEEP